MEAPSLSLYLVMICLVLLGVNGERDDRLRFSMPERRHDLFVAENTIACSGMRPGSAPNSRRYSRASAPTISSGSTPPRLRTAERIVAMRIPDAEHITAAGSQNAQNLGIGFALVQKEHHAELAHDGIEASIREGKRHGIGRLEFDLLAGSEFRAGDIQHRWIEIGRRQACRSRQCVAQLSRDNAGAGRGLQHPRRIGSGDALRDVGGIIDKDHRPHALIVVLRYAADETHCVVAHDRPPPPPVGSIARRRRPAKALMWFTAALDPAPASRSFL